MNLFVVLIKLILKMCAPLPITLSLAHYLKLKMVIDGTKQYFYKTTFDIKALNKLSFQIYLNKISLMVIFLLFCICNPL